MTSKKITCRLDCGACCEAPSISSNIPGMPEGKPAGVKCIHFLMDQGCGIYNRADRPLVCASLKAGIEMCGSSRKEAMAFLERLERDTA